MANITWFTTRQKALEVLAAGANVVYTLVPCSTFVPATATAIIALTELEQVAAPTAGDYAISTKRMDATHEVCSSDEIYYTDAPQNVCSNNAIIPLSPTRQIEYDLNGVFATLTVNVRVYIIGYIS